MTTLQLNDHHKKSLQNQVWSHDDSFNNWHNLQPQYSGLTTVVSQGLPVPKQTIRWKEEIAPTHFYNSICENGIHLIH